MPYMQNKQYKQKQASTRSRNIHIVDRARVISEIQIVWSVGPKSDPLIYLVAQSHVFLDIVRCFITNSISSEPLDCS